MTEDGLTDPGNFDPSKFNLRNKGIRTNAGKIHKGCVKDAFTKLSIGSIPSNYQSIIYRYEQKKGFGTAQKRFYNPNNMSEMIKTQQEMENQMRDAKNKTHVSHSSKGYGPFIAKQKRQWRKYPHSPGPCVYFDKKNLPTSSAQGKKRRNCYTREREEFKIKQIACNKENIANPGPGHYEIQTKNEHTLAGWKSSFATKDNRQGYIPKNNSPGPGCYPPEETSPKKVNQRQFPSEQLYSKLSKDKQHMGKHFLAKPRQPDIPGPGHYDQDIPNFKPLYERIKISYNFIQNNRSRFDQPLEPSPVIQNRKSPTPCTYDVGSSFDKIQKKLIDMSSFMSESRRVVFEGSNNCSQICYDSVKDPQKNFHFNITGKWV